MGLAVDFSDSQGDSDGVILFAQQLKQRLQFVDMFFQTRRHEFVMAAAEQVPQGESAGHVELAIQAADSAQRAFHFYRQLGVDMINAGRPSGQFNRADHFQGCAGGFIDISPLMDQVAIRFQDMVDRLWFGLP